MGTAIVFYSMSRNTKFAAEKIAEVLGADLIEITPKKAYHDKGFKKYFWGGKSAVMGESPELEDYRFSPGMYDTVIIGMPVWASCITPPLRTFIEENKTVLVSKDIACFLCQSGSGAEKVFKKLKSLMDIPTLKAELVLIDPKDKPSDENDKKINDFCEKIKQS